MSELDKIEFKKIEFKPGTIGHEIQRLMLTRNAVDGITDRHSQAAPMLTGFVISFVHFVLGMIVFNYRSEEMPDITDVWGVLNGSDIFRHMALRYAISDFLPILLDTETGEGVDWIEAEKITDIFNEWMTKKAGD